MSWHLGRLAGFDTESTGVDVEKDRIETKLGRPSGKWTEHDVAQLLVAFQSIQRGEVTADEEFPLPRVTVDEIAQQAKQPPAGERAAAGWPETAQPGSGA